MKEQAAVRQDHAAVTRRGDQAVKEAAARAARSVYRLGYHFAPASGWCNDPNGLIHFGGEYHLFYQHNPYGPKTGPMHWGHAASKNLVDWRHLPIALAPTERHEIRDNGGGCYSGSAVDDQGNLCLIYTADSDLKPPEVQCLATSGDGINFEKYAGNPVIAAPPGDGGNDFRDPKAWRHGDSWYCVVGSSKDHQGKILLYRSRDLRAWEYVGVAAESDGTLGTMWECPDLFPLDGRHVLIVSPMGLERMKVIAMVGDFDYATGKFRHTSVHDLDAGPDYYAAQTLLDDKGRRILIAWMQAWTCPPITAPEGWNGAMTLPRQLSLRGDRVVQTPVAEIERLRGRQVRVPATTLKGKTNLPVDFRGEMFEMMVEARVSGSAIFGVRLRCSEDESQQTVVRYDAGKQSLTLDRDQSGVLGGVFTGNVPPEANGILRLRIFVDRSSVEVFANDGAYTITARIFPKAGSDRIGLFSEDGEVALLSCEVWEIREASHS